jgi:hypothetical protein
MTESNLYGGAPLSIDSTIIQGVTKYTRDLRETLKEDAHSGSVHLTDARVIRTAPIISFTTYDIFALFDLLDDSENTPMKNLTGAGVIMYFPKGSLDGPEREASGHVTATIAKGQIYLTKIGWSFGGQGAEAEATLYGLSVDGKTNPIVDGTSTSYPDVLPTETWTLVEVTLPGGVKVIVKSVNIEISHGSETNVEDGFHNGLPFPVRVVSAGTGPNIKIEATLETTDHGAVVAATGAVALKFARYLAGGEVSDTLVRTITLNGAKIRVPQKAWATGAASTRQIIVTALKNGTTLPMTAD